MKILNLYAGIGGNRKLWGDEHEVTAVELDPKIAAIYKEFFPNDNVIVTDAHQYLLEHYKEFDFIWASPPCPTHSRMNLSYGDGLRKHNYPDMNLYQEIIFLQYWFKGKYCVENVISYYKPLIKPQECGRHYFWSNFIILNKKFEMIDISRTNEQQLSKHLDISAPQINARKLLRNCVNPKVALHIFNMAFKERQVRL